ncbi:hypothetical protein HDE_00337 [Halotydeus destructor]|nr:hypothetical protein HDE_00337 [Halotydeus destructor]
MDGLDKNAVLRLKSQLNQLDNDFLESSKKVQENVNEYFANMTKFRNSRTDQIGLLEQEHERIETYLLKEIDTMKSLTEENSKTITRLQSESLKAHREHEGEVKLLKDELRQSSNLILQRDSNIDQLRNEILKAQQSLKSTQEHLTEELNQLEAKYAETGDAKRDLEVKFKDAVRKVAELELASDDLKATIHRQKDELHTSENELSRLQNDYEHLSKDRTQLNSSLEKLKLDYEEKIDEEHKRKQEELEQRSLEFSMARTSLEAKYDEEVTKLKLDNEQLASKYQKEVQQLKRELSSLNSELNEKVSSMSNHMTELNASHEGERARLEDELQTVREALRNKETESRQSSEEFKAQLARISEDHLKVKDVKDKTIDSLQHEIRSYEKILESMSEQQRIDQQAYNEQLGQLKAKFDDIEKDRVAIMSNLRAANDKILNWEGKFVKKANEVDEANNRCDLMEEEKNVLQGEVVAMRQILGESTNEIKELNAAINELKSKAVEESRDRANLAANLKKLRETLREVEDSRTTLKKELNSSRLKCSQLESEVRAVKTEAAELENSLERRRSKQHEKNGEFQSMKANLQELENEKRNLKQDNSALKLKLSDRESQLSVKSESLGGLESKVTRLQRELDKVETANRTLSEKHALQRSFFEKELERQVRVDKGNQTPSRDRRSVGPKVETSAIAEGLVALEQEHSRLQDKVQSLQSLMSEAESFSRNSGNGNGFDRLREAQLQAEQLLDGARKSTSNRKTRMSMSTSNVESEIVQLRRNLTTSLSASSSKAASPSSVHRTANGSSEPTNVNQSRPSSALPKTSTPAPRDSGISLGLRGDSTSNSTKRRLDL